MPIPKQIAIADSYFLSDGVTAKDEIMLFPFGKFEHPQYGKLNFDEKFFGQIIENYNNDVLHTKPFIDVEHQMGKALAWLDETPYIKHGIGLFVRPTWNEQGKQLLADRTYRYFSPWYEDFTDAQSGKTYKNVLRGGAVTNIPFIKTMPPIVDDETSLNEVNSVKILLSELKYEERINNEPEIKFDEGDELKIRNSKKIKESNMDFIAELRKALHLDESASESDILVKLGELTKVKTDEVKPESVIMAEDTRVKKLEETIAHMSMQMLSEKCSRVLSDAVRAGQVKPVDKEKWEKRYMSDPDGIAEIISELPVSINLSEIGTGNEPETNSDDPIVQLSDKATAIAKEKNISFSAALDEARKQNPELSKAYFERYRNGGK